MGNWFSWLSSNSTNFEKDFDDIIKGLEINKETLTKENIIDKVFEAIWDDKEYPEKKNKSHISSIIKKLEKIIGKLSEKLEKIPENQVEQKEELILYIVESTEKIKKNIAYLKKSMKNFPNAPLTNSSSNKNPTPVNNPNNAAVKNSAAKNDATRNVAARNNSSKSYAKPKSARYFLSKAPLFSNLFGANENYNIFSIYGVNNEDLDENNFAKTFIHKILSQDIKNLDQKIQKLQKLKSSIEAVRYKELLKDSPTYSARMIIINNMKKYQNEIDEVIQKLNLQKTKNTGANNRSAVKLRINKKSK